MRISPAVLLSLLILISGNQVRGQVVSGSRSSDSTHVYKSIESFSKKRKITQLIFPLFFKPTETVLSGSHPNPVKYKQRESYSDFEGKVIRNITILSMDPFGYDVNDTSRKPHSSILNFGNNLHIKSLALSIRNYLLIKRNEPFDSLLVAESERLVRKQSFVHDVRLIPYKVSNDSVDIIIRVQDVWSLIPDGSVSMQSFSFKLKEENFMGTGQQFKYTDDYTIDSRQNAFGFGYFIPNIDNSYVTVSLGYNQARDKSFEKLLSVDRTFYSPYAKWAGGFLLQQVFQKDSLVLSDTYRILQTYKRNTYDYWGGTAWQVMRGRTETERNTNLVFTARWKRSYFLERPSAEFDPLNNFNNSTLYLLSAGFNSRKYIRDMFLFRFGVHEDVPIGRTYSITGGLQVKNREKSGYLGIRSSWGDYYSFGYVAANLEYGTFFNKSKPQEGALVAGITYFTNLQEFGGWRFRQFLKSDVVIGFNRLPADRLNFNDYMGVNGFDSKTYFGTQKIHLTIQTQSYAPWNLLGFRFGPFMTATLGMVGDESNGFSKSRVYSYVGAGVLIKNDFLNANYLQISLSFYPYIPETGYNVFRANSFQPSDFRLQEFGQGKPEVVAYF